MSELGAHAFAGVIATPVHENPVCRVCTLKLTNIQQFLSFCCIHTDMRAKAAWEAAQICKEGCTVTGLRVSYTATYNVQVWPKSPASTSQTAYFKN